jgi:hypothetical protein
VVRLTQPRPRSSPSRPSRMLRFTDMNPTSSPTAVPARAAPRRAVPAGFPLSA